MADLHKFIENVSFNDIEKLVEPLDITVKQSGKLFMLSFKDSADFNNPIVRQANGTIFEKNTNKLIHYGFEKCYDGIKEQYKIGDTIDFTAIDLNANSRDIYMKKMENYRIELYFEGSLIKLYYYQGEWKVSTSRHIDAEKNFWASNKSFKHLFVEALKFSYNIDSLDEYFDKLDKNSVYTLLMQHPENNMIHSSCVPILYNINKIDMTNEDLIEERLDKENLKVDLKIDELDRKTKNYMVYIENKDNSISRIKLLSEKFMSLKEIRSNNADIAQTYLEYLKDKNKLDKLISEFPEHFETFDKMNQLVETTCKNIHNLYYQIYINKSVINIPKYYEKTLKQLHGQYKRYKLPIRLEDVVNKVYSMDHRIISYILQYKK